MKIALDYDLTYSAAPELWDHFIHKARDLGHDVRIVTARDERFDRTMPIARLGEWVPVIYCRGIAKKWFCTHFVADFVPDVWIDDKPESVAGNSTATPEVLVEWREARNEGPSL
jgi:hypothetical protein